MVNSAKIPDAAAKMRAIPVTCHGTAAPEVRSATASRWLSRAIQAHRQPARKKIVTGQITG